MHYKLQNLTDYTPSHHQFYNCTSYPAKLIHKVKVGEIISMLPYSKQSYEPQFLKRLVKCSKQESLSLVNLIFLTHTIYETSIILLII